MVKQVETAPSVMYFSKVSDKNTQVFKDDLALLKRLFVLAFTPYVTLLLSIFGLWCVSVCLWVHVKRHTVYDL